MTTKHLRVVPSPAPAERSSRPHGGPSVVIVDIPGTARSLLESVARTLEPNTLVVCYADPEAALVQMRSSTPDLIVTDARLPGLGGNEFIRHIRAERNLADVPILLTTLAEDRQIRSVAFENGATDFLLRPLDLQECRARCRTLLALRRSQRAMHESTRWLEDQVMQATREVRVRERETLLKLAKAGEYRDLETGNHIVRMAKYSRLIAEALCLSTMECEEIEAAAPMHDIGKIGIPDHILLKPGSHTEDEQRIMRSHPEIGYQILAGSPSRYLQMGAIIALSHHERFDGSGYPHGLAGEAIPLSARIVAVADVFDALTSSRPYKKVWSVQDALGLIQSENGTHFDPACCHAFQSRLDAVSTIMRDFGDTPADA